MNDIAQNYYSHLVKAVITTNECAKKFYSFDEETHRKNYYSHSAALVEKDLASNYPNLTQKEKNIIIAQQCEILLNDEKQRRLTGRSSTIIKLEEVINRTLSQQGISLENFPYFAELPTGKLNATIIKVPNTTQYLVLFENQIYTFVLLLSKVFALSLPIYRDRVGESGISIDDSSIARHLYNNPEAFQRFYELITAYVLTGSVNNAPKYIPSYEVSYITEQLIHSMEIFVVAHEFGHLINGHFEKSNDFNIVENYLGIKPVNEVHFNWNLEWEADVTGAQLALASSLITGITLPWVYTSIQLFFHGLHFFDRASSLFSKETYNPEDKRILVKSLSHPAPALRHEHLFGSNGIEKDASGLSEIVVKILNILWYEIEPKLLELKSKLKTE